MSKKKHLRCTEVGNILYTHFYHFMKQPNVFCVVFFLVDLLTESIHGRTPIYSVSNLELSPSTQIAGHYLPCQKEGRAFINTNEKQPTALPASLLSHVWHFNLQELVRHC